VEAGGPSERAEITAPHGAAQRDRVRTGENWRRGSGGNRRKLLRLPDWAAQHPRQLRIQLPELNSRGYLEPRFLGVESELLPGVGRGLWYKYM